MLVREDRGHSALFPLAFPLTRRAGQAQLTARVRTTLNRIVHSGGDRRLHIHKNL